jgi:hypothetical protein
MRNMFPASGCKDVLQEKKQVRIVHDVGAQKAHFSDTARDLTNGNATLPQWVQDDGKRRTEAPENPDDDPCCESTHAINGTCEEERERDQNKQDNSLAGIKSSESVPERGEITDQGC